MAMSPELKKKIQLALVAAIILAGGDSLHPVSAPCRKDAAN